MVCYQLGYAVGVASHVPFVSSAPNPIWSSNLSCSGWEGSIGQCADSQWKNVTSCESNYSAVTCAGKPL